jgi:hypothetical protein
MSRASTRFIARLLVAVLLLAQWSIAAYACPGLGATAPAMRIDTAAATAAGTATATAPEGEMPGCTGMVAALDQDATNLCAEHCKVGQQSHEVPALSVPLPWLSALYAVPLVPLALPPARPWTSTLDALVAASPPLAVLHCIYRT